MSGGLGISWNLDRTDPTEMVGITFHRLNRLARCDTGCSPFILWFGGRLWSFSLVNQSIPPLQTTYIYIRSQMYDICMFRFQKQFCYPTNGLLRIILHLIYNTSLLDKIILFILQTQMVVNALRIYEIKII